MKEDPHPELRCRCVSRRRSDDPEVVPSDYIDRCDRRGTKEDGLCDECRDRAEEVHPEAEYMRYLLGDPSTPCWDKDSDRF